MYFIGIAGGSGSGKTTFGKKLLNASPSILTISMDSYYLPTISDIPKTKSGKPNFDHPKAFDWELFRTHLSQLNNGESVNIPIYDFNESVRVKNKHLAVRAENIVIIEGIFTLYDPVIRKILSVKCFLDVACDVRFIRRLERDVKERGRDLDSIINQYYDSVRPMYKKYLEPQKQHADIVIGHESDIASSVLSSQIKQISNERNSNTTHDQMC
jgi:uridine kinase